MKNKFSFLAVSFSVFCLTSCVSNAPSIDSVSNIVSDSSSIDDSLIDSSTSDNHSIDNHSLDNPSVDDSSDSASDSSTSDNPSISIDESYYSAVSDSDNGTILKTKLYNIIKGHTKLNYDKLEEYMRITDRDWTRSPDQNDTNPYMNLLYYTKNNDSELQQTWNKYHSSNNPNTPQMWDKEHIWAKSNGFPNSSQSAYSDLHHLRASDMKNNNTRSSYPFANLDSVSKTVDDFSQTASGKMGKADNVIAYEPLDMYKGDIARALLYMATRYGSESISLELTDGTNSSGGKWGFLSDLLTWNLQDKPDSFEQNRNDLVFGLQKNRNPFIDHPEYACRIYSSTSNNTLKVCK